MYILWLIIGGIAIVCYLTLELKVSYHVIRKSTLPGKKGYYILISFVLTFTIISAIYFSAINDNANIFL